MKDIKKEFEFRCDALYGNTCCVFKTNDWISYQDGIDIILSAKCPSCGNEYVKKIISIVELFDMVAVDKHE